MVKTRSTAEELWAPKFTPSFLKKRCDLMQRILKKHDPKGVYRKNTKEQSDVFNTKFSFLLGATTNALGAVAFTTPIAGKPGRGMCVTPLYDQQKPKWQKALYALADEIISVADPEFSKGDYGFTLFTSAASTLQSTMPRPTSMEMTSRTNSLFSLGISKDARCVCTMTRAWPLENSITRTAS